MGVGFGQDIYSRPLAASLAPRFGMVPRRAPCFGEPTIRTPSSGQVFRFDVAEEGRRIEPLAGCLFDEVLG